MACGQTLIHRLFHPDGNIDQLIGGGSPIFTLESARPSSLKRAVTNVRKSHWHGFDIGVAESFWSTTAITRANFHDPSG